jgi:hypothetical protein
VAAPAAMIGVLARRATDATVPPASLALSTTSGARPFAGELDFVPVAATTTS